jgi:hypothetical protein
MTWYVTWTTRGGGVGYEEARHETDAEARAKAVVDSGKATKATYYEIDQEGLSA